VSIHVYWFLLALVLLGLEMASGTFYLLVVSIALAAGGAVAYTGANLVWQLMLCAITVIAGSIILRYWKGARVNELASASLDIGQPVKVVKWHENGKARVLYRGAEWDAELKSSDLPRIDTLYIAAVHGSTLVLTDHQTKHQ
jgi:membrane protein implicated in regulation of membrane protease activity